MLAPGCDELFARCELRRGILVGHTYKRAERPQIALVTSLNSARPGYWRSVRA
jgi:hypothetical protein